MVFWNPNNSNESVVSVKIGANKVSFTLLGFNFICIVIGLLALQRDIDYADQGHFVGDVIGLWNGYSNATCFTDDPSTNILSLIKRFNLEPYVRLGFRFALMFSGALRIFLCYCKIQMIQYDCLKNGRKSIIILAICKTQPIIMASQVLQGAIMLMCNPQLDLNYLSHIPESLTYSFFYTTAVYMCFSIAIDWHEATSLSHYFRSSRYLIRAVTYLLFIITFIPVLLDYSTYLQRVTCHTFASSIPIAVAEYTTLLSIMIFHLSEHFDISSLEFNLVEKELL